MSEGLCPWGATNTSLVVGRLITVTLKTRKGLFPSRHSDEGSLPNKAFSGLHLFCFPPNLGGASVFCYVDKLHHAEVRAVSVPVTRTVNTGPDR